MISKISLDREETHLVPLVSPSLPSRIKSVGRTDGQIFLDTLHHFPETVQLANTAAENYLAPLHIYTPPNVSTAEEFSAKYGEKLWESDEASYDYLVKVEPAARAYAELGVKAVITGRRRSQGAEREGLQVLEVDERGLIKVNPLISWSFKEVKEYVDKE
jgi:phosphoadenosine phosphosulfate reductase